MGDSRDQGSQVREPGSGFRGIAAALLVLILTACTPALSMPTPLSQNGPKDETGGAPSVIATLPLEPISPVPSATPAPTATSGPRPVPALLEGVATFVFSLPGIGSGPAPTGVAPAPTLASGGSSGAGYQFYSVAFMAGQNISGQPLTWRRCADESHYRNPAASCPQVPSVNESETRPGSVLMQNGGVFLAPDGVVTVYFLLIDSTGATWASPTLDGRDLLPWCGPVEVLGRNEFLALYDFSVDPAYNFFEDNVIDWFDSPNRTASEALECP